MFQVQSSPVHWENAMKKNGISFAKMKNIKIEKKIIGLWKHF